MKCPFFNSFFWRFTFNCYILQCFVNCFNKNWHIKVCINFFCQCHCPWVTHDFLYGSFLHLCFRQHRDRSMSGTVWCSINPKLLHQWGPVDTIIIIILEPFAFFVVEKILTFRAGIIPALIERQHLICDRYFSYSVLCLAINDIKVLFVKVYVFLL